MDLNKKSYNNRKSVEVYDLEKDKWTEGYIYDNYFLNKKGKIIDIGCGTGRTSIRLHSFGLDVEAIDYSDEMIKRAREKFGDKISFKVMDVRSLNYPDNFFDYAFFSFNGIDYLYPESSREKALKEIFRVLKPGGIFAFSSHNSNFLPDNFGRIVAFLKSVLCGKIHPYRIEFHPFGNLLTRYISLKKQKNDLSAVGFEVIEVVSKYGKDESIVNRKDPYPSYVCRK